jgi:catechol 2,3-dioxygenase-like lactoylglutathione lyase family enzyme
MAKEKVGMLKEIEHIDIAVKDLEESIKLFQKMGFKLLVQTTHAGGAAELKLPGPHQPIFELHPIVPNIPEGTSGHLGIIHIGFTVDDAQKALDWCNEEGIPLLENKVGFQPQTGRIQVHTQWLGDFFLCFVQKGRKPFITHSVE